MSARCKDQCTNFRATRCSNGFRYTLGQKRCSYCSIYVNVDGFNCPCCGGRLRTKPRKSASKRSSLNLR